MIPSGVYRCLMHIAYLFLTYLTVQMRVHVQNVLSAGFVARLFISRGFSFGDDLVLLPTLTSYLETRVSYIQNSQITPVQLLLVRQFVWHSACFGRLAIHLRHTFATYEL